ncbi:aminotransferase class V-fold PLP-dependent enzyme [Govanella unica]|uniref:Aminotransferase class V-fold PLP-dependent enzyme n=1 Tax=Govanella unica TaxID=2975056 RepID=A0A9X3Z7S7_9PROT|nr:aminotransferase class V-fold PLP-dependent enzyme [Govania unica]MDA5194550.1 aminotransferase class V-fold PLP-dependent enzyme [Govania unica]
MIDNFTALRRKFPVLAKKTYVNSGSYAALSLDVKAAFEAYLDGRLAEGAAWDHWAGINESVRAAMANLLKVTADEVAVTTSASAGINALASAMDFSGPRNKVVISDFEFPTNAQIWHAQSKRGAEILHVPVDAEGYIPLDHFRAAIDEHTALVAVTHVCYRNGAKLDIKGIARIAHEKGARLLVDCYQSVGTECLDMKALDVDFAVGGMLKYLLGTAGISFMYVRDELIPGLVPTTSGWFAQADIGAMNIKANHPSPTARRFEAGTPPVVNCYAAEAGLKIVQDVGLPAIEQHVRALSRYYLDRLAAEGFITATPTDDARRGPMVAVRAKDDTALVARLAARDIVTSSRDGNMRASFHFYNNEEDVEALIAGLKANRELLL